MNFSIISLAIALCIVQVHSRPAADPCLGRAFAPPVNRIIYINRATGAVGTIGTGVGGVGTGVGTNNSLITAIDNYFLANFGRLPTAAELQTYYSSLVTSSTSTGTVGVGNPGGILSGTVGGVTVGGTTATNIGTPLGAAGSSSSSTSTTVSTGVPPLITAVVPNGVVNNGFDLSIFQNPPRPATSSSSSSTTTTTTTQTAVPPLIV